MQNKSIREWEKRKAEQIFRWKKERDLNNWGILKFKLHLSFLFGRMDKWNEVMAEKK